MNLADVTEKDAYNLRPPCDVSWFQRQLDSLGRDAGTQLRIMWAADVWWVDGLKNVQRPYAVYLAEEHTGWKVYKPVVVDGIIADLQYIKRVPASYFNESPRKPFYYRAMRDEIWEPEVSIEQIAARRWVIEERILGYREQVDREVHNRIRYETDPDDPKVLIDFMGPYPAQGNWETLRVIAEHDPPKQLGQRPPCCTREWEEEGAICYGRYKEPGEDDLNYVRGLCQAKLQLELVRDPNQPPTIEERRRWWRDYQSRREEAEQKMADYYYDMFLDVFQPAFAAHFAKKFDIGVAYQKAANNQAR